MHCLWTSVQETLSISGSVSVTKHYVRILSASFKHLSMVCEYTINVSERDGVAKCTTCTSFADTNFYSLAKHLAVQEGRAALIRREHLPQDPRVRRLVSPGGLRLQ